MDANSDVLLNVGNTMIRRRPASSTGKRPWGMAGCEVLINGQPIKCRRLVVTFDLHGPPEVVVEYLEHPNEE